MTWIWRWRLTWMLTCLFADMESYMAAYVSILVGPTSQYIYGLLNVFISYISVVIVKSFLSVWAIIP